MNEEKFSGKAQLYKSYRPAYPDARWTFYTVSSDFHPTAPSPTSARARAF